MFDDPQKRLKWMEQALQEEEAAPGMEHDAARSLPQEDQDLMRRVDALLEDMEPEPPAAPAPRHRRTAAEKLQRSVQRESFDETMAVRPQPRQKGIGGLVVLAVLETAAIAAVAMWWLQWL